MIKLGFSQEGKKISIDDKPLLRASEHIKRFFSFIFSPDDLSAFKSQPAVRRYFADRVLSISNHTYFERLRNFKRIRQQKNTVLKSGRQSDLEAWNRQLAESIIGICTDRKNFTDYINGKVRERRFGSDEKLYFDVGYYPSVEFEDKSSDQILAYLMSKKERELTAGVMLYGPHRDNWDFVISPNIKGRDFFSQGQYRMAFLELILSANCYLEDNQAQNPVILLDDIFSELDDVHTDRLMETLLDLKNQIFITGITRKKMNKGYTFNIQNNAINRLDT